MSGHASAITGVKNDAAWHPSVPVGHSGFTWGRFGQAEGGRLHQAAPASSSAASKKGNKADKASSSSSSSSSSSAPALPPAVAGPPIVLGKTRPSGPILPVKDRRNVLITSALPYVNNVPHLGNIIGCCLSGDVYARFCRLRGHNALYVCGTDEYGTATERKAIEEGLTPQAICDKYHVIHKEIYDWFNIEFDKFGRTTTPQQTEIAQEIYLQLEKNGWSSEKDTKELYCEFHQKFLADRFVEGTCPKCKYEDARGDQCDGCGSTLDAIELIEPKCKMCKEAYALDKNHPMVAPKVVTSRHLFLDLEKLQPQLSAWIEKAKVKGEWSDNAIQITMAQLTNGLKSRPITKDLKWGTPVPKAGYEKKVFYVWFDAPIGYISITANYTPEWRQWWHNPDNVDLVQFMGKDNIPFHTVMFPASLIAAAPGKYTLLHHVSCTEYLNYEGTKFSKSRNTGVFGDDAISTGIPSEVWRYYLLFNRPEQADTIFLWEDFAAKTNTELNNNLGNFINRTLSFIYSKLGNTVPKPNLTAEDQQFIKEVSALKKEYINFMEHVAIKDGLKTVMAISGKSNQFMQHSKPWELFKTDRARADTILYLSVNLISLLAVLLEPFMPSLTAKINAQLNQKLEGLSALDAKDPSSEEFVFNIPAGHVLGVPAPLFKKIEDEEIAALRLRFGGQPVAKKSGEAFPLKLIVGTIEEAKEHEGAPHLYVIQIATNEPEEESKAGEEGKNKLLRKGYRQVVAGLRPFYEPKDLVGKQLAVLANLKPSNFKGVRSEGMLLTAVMGKTLGLLTPPAGVVCKNGELVVPRDCNVEPKGNFDVKKELKKLGLITRGANGTVCFGANPLEVTAADGKLVEIRGENVGEGAGLQ